MPTLGAGSGLLPTEFQVSEAGLRARIRLEGNATLERVEAVHALARGRYAPTIIRQRCDRCPPGVRGRARNGPGKLARGRW